MIKKDSRHCSTEELVDFVTLQATAEETARIRQHLGAGCKKCGAAQSLWNRVLRTASRETLVPPASAIQHVRQAFAIVAETGRPKRAALIPRLVFDSAWQPAMAGVRSGADTPQRVLYKTRSISIEMHLEPVPRSERVNIAGQVTLAEQAETLPPIAVLLSGRKGKLASTSTNDFGEFNLAFVPEDGLRISFAMADSEELLVPLDGSGLRIFYRN
jgi:hypothetical protein